MQSFYFYHEHLKKVSRSFSLCISQLLSPAKEWVALSYLLLRIIDTVEDSPWNDDSLQYEVFSLLKLFLIKTPSEEQFSNWLRLFPNEIPLNEKNLIMDLLLLLEEKNQLPGEIRNELTTTMMQMIDGMKHFLYHYKSNSAITLPSLITTNQYCFFVAGIVGTLLTRIFTYLIPDFQWTPLLLNQSLHFGLFLQKINILKDHKLDEAEGRHYIISRESLRISLVTNALHAFNYLKSIPIIDGRSYRLFCAWSLFIGLASLKWLNKNWQLQQQKYKIKSRETLYLINQISRLIDDNQALEHLFHLYLDCDNQPSSFQEQENIMPLWFNNIYSNPHSSIDWVALGMQSQT